MLAATAGGWMKEAVARLSLSLSLSSLRGPHREPLDRLAVCAAGFGYGTCVRERRFYAESRVTVGLRLTLR
jgi:hypothetical protein